MKNPDFNRDYGKWMAGIIPLLGLILIYTIWRGLGYNRLSFGFNLTSIIVTLALSLLLIKKYHATRPVLLFLFYIMSVFLLFNLILSLAIARVEDSPGLDNDAKGLSWLIILPATWFAIIIWGFVFDRVKNKAIRNREVNEQ